MKLEMRLNNRIKALLWSVLVFLSVTACSTTPHAVETPAAAPQEVQQHYSACTEDRRKEYTTIEVPSVTQTRGVPAAFLQQLQAAIIDFGRQHKVWHVLPTTPEVDNVVVLALSVESWTPDATAGGESGALAMKLDLIDKANQCEVGETTGEGTIVPTAEEGFPSEGIQNIAQGAGWFVGTTLLHTL